MENVITRKRLKTIDITNPDTALNFYGVTIELVEALHRMFDDPTFQSVFLMAAKHGVTYQGEEMNDYMRAVESFIYDGDEMYNDMLTTHSDK